jgi:hypothetical protein
MHILPDHLQYFFSKDITDSPQMKEPRCSDAASDSMNELREDSLDGRPRASSHSAFPSPFECLNLTSLKSEEYLSYTSQKRSCYHDLLKSIILTAMVLCCLPLPSPICKQDHSLIWHIATVYHLSTAVAIVQDGKFHQQTANRSAFSVFVTSVSNSSFQIAIAHFSVTLGE